LETVTNRPFDRTYLVDRGQKRKPRAYLPGAVQTRKYCVIPGHRDSGEPGIQALLLFENRLDSRFALTRAPE
jgi:hypothetical protein